MSKPDLPFIPADILERKYKPSGVCSGKTLFGMIAAGLPAGAIIGVIGYYGGYLVSLLTVLTMTLQKVCGGCGGISACGVLLAMIIVMFIAALGYPAVLGVLLGWVIWLLAKWGKCRSSGKAALVSFFSALIGYGVFTFIAFQSVDRVATMARLVDLAFELQTAPWWLYILAGLDALIFTVAASAMTMNMVEENPFCEHCGQWYGQWRERRFTLDLIEPLAQAVTQKTWNIPSFQATQATQEQFPHLVGKIRKCSSCSNDFQLMTRVVWEEEKKNTRGETKQKQKDEVWFDIMLPAETGIQLENWLFHIKRDSSLEPKRTAALQASQPSVPAHAVTSMMSPAQPAAALPSLPEPVEKTAALVKEVSGYNGPARVYKVAPPVEANLAKAWEAPKIIQTDYVVVVSVEHPIDGPEVNIFPADESGKALEWTKLSGSCSGTISHDEAIRQGGYKLPDLSVSPSPNLDRARIRRRDRVQTPPDLALLSSLKMGNQNALQRALMMRNQAALAAIEETIALYAGKSDITFYQVGGLKVTTGHERQAARQKIQELAQERQLLDDPAYSQCLIAQLGAMLNDQMMDELSFDVQALYDYQLLGVHLQIAAMLS